MTPIAYGREWHEHLRVPVPVRGLTRLVVFVGTFWSFLAVVTHG